MPLLLVIVGVVIVVGAVALAVVPGNERVPEASESVTVETIVPDNGVVEKTVAQDSDKESLTINSDITMDPVVSSETTNIQAADFDYTDGTYSTDVLYRVPSGDMEPMTVSLTLQGDIVTAAEFDFEGVVGTSRLNQAKFLKAYETEVIGKDIDTLNLSRVGGASLTTNGFNDALEKIKAEAAA